MAAPHIDPTIDDEWLPDADALATVLALLRRHRLTSVEHLLISELECRAEAATRAVAALSASSVSEASDEHARAPAAVVSGDRCAMHRGAPLTQRLTLDTAFLRSSTQQPEDRPVSLGACTRATLTPERQSDNRLHSVTPEQAAIRRVCGSCVIIRWLCYWRTTGRK
jgi:hypothetical protein